MTPPLFDSPAAKVYANGTARTRPPAETLALVEPLSSRFGVTRLANVTGLDRLGIPVYQAVRPNARSLSVSQGKGLDDTSAKVSALMESLEAFHAEHASCWVRLDSHRALSRRFRVADPARLPLAKATRFHPDASLPWVEGRDLGTSETVLVPFELVHANFTVPRIPGSGAFVPSTNGLGAGNHPAEAALHGLAELVERDAETLWRLRGGEADQARRVSPASVDHPEAARLLAAYREAGIHAMIWDMTSDVQVASFVVIIFDPEANAVLNPCPAANGSGCHPDRGIALCRALTEAAQSRLTAIAGSRDDFSAATYRAFQRAESLEHYRRLVTQPAGRSFTDAPDRKGHSLDEDLAHILERLAARGMREAILVDLSTPGLGLTFLRMIVPGLEASMASPSYTPGARALASVS